MLERRLIPRSHKQRFIFWGRRAYGAASFIGLLALLVWAAQRSFA
jgi:hypothetical protein